jgi:hypothetical protein
MGREEKEIFRAFNAISLLPGVTGSGGVAALKCEAEGAPAAKAEALILPDKAVALSPATPLSFPPSSESDEKPKQDRKRKFSLKRVFLSFFFILYKFS